MPLTRSNEDLTATGNQTVCGICSAIVQNPSDSHKTPCGHEFHKTCIKSHIKSSSNCPICKVSWTPAAKQSTNSPAYGTRSQSAVATVTAASMAEETASSSASVNLTSDLINRMQNQIISALTVQITKLIEENVEACVSRRSVTPQRSENEYTGSNGLVGLAVEVSPVIIPPAGPASVSQGSYKSDLLQRPDKVGHILNGCN